jgi:hypothetical protein
MAKLPKAVFGPYMLYLFFVAFHFDDNLRYWWLYYGWLAIAGVVVSVMAVIEKVEGRMEKGRRRPEREKQAYWSGHNAGLLPRALFFIPARPRCRRSPEGDPSLYVQSG